MICVLSCSIWPLQPVAFRNPVLELLVLAVHDELRLRPIAPQLLELLQLLGERVHDQLRFGAIAQDSKPQFGSQSIRNASRAW